MPSPTVPVSLMAQVFQLCVATSMALGMLQDPYSEIRGLATRVLATNVDSARLRLVSEYARDGSPNVREQAMLAAGRMGDAAVAVSVGGLRDRSPAVRQGAVWAASHGGDKAFAPVTQMLRIERSSEVLTTAIANLWRFEGEPWEAHASRFASHEDPSIRRAAASALVSWSVRV